MENQQDSTTSQPITLTLEVVPEDPQNSDPALVDAVGRDTADALRSEGYTVQPVYTGIRGGPLVETIAFLSQTLAAAWANKEALIRLTRSELVKIPRCSTPSAFRWISMVCQSPCRC